MDPTLRPNPPDPDPDHHQEARRFALQMQHLHGLVSSRTMRDFADQMQDDDLSFSQIATLFHLRHAGELTVSSLAAQTRLSLAATSHLVERLVRRELVERRENPENRREKLVALSASALRLLEQRRAHIVEAYSSALKDVPGELLRDAERALAALLGHLKHPEHPPHSPAHRPSTSPEETP